MAMDAAPSSARSGEINSFSRTGVNEKFWHQKFFFANRRKARVDTPRARLTASFSARETPSSKQTRDTHMRGGFLLWAAAAAGFGGLLPRERRALSDADAPEAPAAFTAAADECRERIGHTLGEVWMQCVVDRLLVAMGDPTSTHPPFATVPHTFDPLAPLPSHAGEAGYASSHRLKDLLRDYSCDASGPGSTPSRRFAWTHTPHDPCAAAEREEAGGGVGGGGGAEGAFLYRRGFLPAGDSLGELDGEMIPHRPWE